MVKRTIHKTAHTTPNTIKGFIKLRETNWDLVGYGFEGVGVEQKLILHWVKRNGEDTNVE